MENGFIKLYRQMVNWEWYTDTPTKVVFIHLLLKANWQDGRFKGYDVPAGSLVTSVAKLVKETGLSTQQVKTALNHLKSTSEITIKTTNKFTLITVENWWDFQVDEQRINKLTNKVLNKQLTNNQQTTNNNIRNKEGKNKKKIIINDVDEKKSSIREQFLFVSKDEDIPLDKALRVENVSRQANGIEVLDESAFN